MARPAVMARLETVQPPAPAAIDMQAPVEYEERH
jgi:hypothetical protein